MNPEDDENIYDPPKTKELGPPSKPKLDDTREFYKMLAGFLLGPGFLAMAWEYKSWPIALIAVFLLVMMVRGHLGIKRKLGK